MKTQPKRLAFIALLSAIIFHPPSLRAQGALTPPGAPGPTMKSLDQLEPRTIVNAVNTPGDAGDTFIISQPGSYYLTTNFTATSAQNGITITTNNVTLDLNGFAAQGPGTLGTAFGIYIPNAQNNVTVRNGAVSGWGGSSHLGAGVYAASASSANLVFEHLNVSGSFDGIYLRGGGAVRECTVANNAGIGIDCNPSADVSGESSIAGCTIANNGLQGIYMFYGNISGCVVNDNGAGGVYIQYGIVVGCTAYYNDGVGIDGDESTISSCLAYGSGSDGIDGNECTVSGCTTGENYGYGISVSGGTVSGCTTGYNTDSGIYGVRTVSVSGCTTFYNGNNGVELDSNGGSTILGTLSDCVVQSNNKNGIFVNGTGGLITGNSCTSNNVFNTSGCAGINIYFTTGNRIENNHVAGTGYAGITVNGSNNLIIKNSVTGNGANDYIINGTEMTGPIITATGIISSTSPWANFAF